MERISQAVNQAVEYLLFFLGFSMVMIVAAQVFARYVLNHSIFWSEELARFLLIWLTFLGSSVAYRRQAHASIDVVFRRLPPAGRRAAVLAVHLVTLFFAAVMVYFGARFAYFVRLQISPALYLPKWIPHSIIAVSGMVWVLHAVAFFIRDYKKEGRR